MTSNIKHKKCTSSKSNKTGQKNYPARRQQEKNQLSVLVGKNVGRSMPTTNIYKNVKFVGATPTKISYLKEEPQNHHFHSYCHLKNKKSIEGKPAFLPKKENMHWHSSTAMVIKYTLPSESTSVEHAGLPSSSMNSSHYISSNSMKKYQTALSTASKRKLFSDFFTCPVSSPLHRRAK